MKKKLKKINNIKIFNIKSIKNAKGNIFKILSSKSNFFNNFGDCYISEINSLKLKAWRCHKRSIQNIFIISGKCKLVVYFKNKFHQIYLSSISPKLVIIPNNAWYGFQNMGTKKVKLLNITNRNYSEKEILRKKKNEIDYDWKKNY